MNIAVNSAQRRRAFPGSSASPVAAVLCGVLPACGVTPPAYISDEAEAAVYAEALPVARGELGLESNVPVHPYLAVGVDSVGRPTVDLSAFEYEASAALRLLQQRDTTLTLCHVDDLGTCEGQYLVVSRITRLGERDAVIVVLVVRGQNEMRQLLIRLRYRRDGWSVSGSSLIA